MYLWVRLVIYALTMWRRTALDPPLGISCLRYSAWPTDIDASLHVNNSRYAVLADLGRFDLVARMGLTRILMKQGLIPILRFSSIRFRREIRVFDPFKVESRVLSWEGTNIFIEHKFTLTGGRHAGQVAALMIAKTGLYSRKERSYITCDELLRLRGLDVSPPPHPETVRTIFAADDAFQQATSGERV